MENMITVLWRQFRQFQHETRVDLDRLDEMDEIQCAGGAVNGISGEYTRDELVAIELAGAGDDAAGHAGGSDPSGGTWKVALMSFWRSSLAFTTR